MRNGVDADALHDLGLRFDAIVVNALVPAADPRVRAAAGDRSVTLHLSDGADLSLDVDHTSSSRDTLPVPAVFSVTNATSAPLRVLSGGSGLVVTFDVLQATPRAQAGPLHGAAVHDEGPDGSVTFRWSVTRA